MAKHGKRGKGVKFASKKATRGLRRGSHGRGRRGVEYLAEHHEGRKRTKGRKHARTTKRNHARK